MKRIINVKIENLKRMVDYLKTLSESNLNMRTYRDTSDIGLLSTPECNTVGCIIGHCTVLDYQNVVDNFTTKRSEMIASSIEDRGKKYIDFCSWSENFTGIPQTEELWMFLFASEWKDVDNSLDGAIARLNYVIKDVDKAITEIEKIKLSYNDYENIFVFFSCEKGLKLYK